MICRNLCSKNCLKQISLLKGSGKSGIPCLVYEGSFAKEIDASLKEANEEDSRKRRITDQNTEAIRRLGQEDTRRDMAEYADLCSADVLRGVWEGEGERRALCSRVRREVERVQQDMERELEKRRSRLYDLLHSEEESFLREAIREPEELEQDSKCSRMLDRYVQLKTLKEEERQKLAYEKREQQFKRNCEELRSRVSRRLQHETAEEARRMAAERRRTAALLRNVEEAAYSEMWRRDAEVKGRREEWEAEERRRKARECGGQVTEQMEDIRRRRRKELLQKEEDAEIRAEQNRLHALEVECVKAAKRRSQESMKSGLNECLKMKLKLRTIEAQEDIAEDIFFLTQIMGEEKERAARDEKKKSLMHEQQEFLAYLRDRARTEQEFERDLDRMCQEELDRAWSRRQEEGSEEKKKRRSMEQGVLKGVQEQIKDNMEQYRRSQCVNREYARKVLEEDEEDRRRDAEKMILMRERNVRHQEELLDQIRAKKERLEQERSFENAELEALRKAREGEEAKIRHLVAEMKIDCEHPYRVGRRETFQDCGDAEN